jgi:hypothetical protein
LFVASFVADHLIMRETSYLVRMLHRTRSGIALPVTTKTTLMAT